MDNHTATEIAYKNGYEQGKKDAVKHGEWENHPNQLGFVRCSVCYDCIIWGEWADGTKWQYCPNCGAKMDGGDQDA